MPTAEEILQSSLRGIDLPTATSAASTEYFFFWSNTNNRLEKLLKSNINTNPYFSYDAFGLIPSAGTTTTDQEIEDEINSTGFTILAGEVKFLQCNVLINSVVHVRVYQYLPNAAGTYGTTAGNEIAFSNLFKLEELVLSQSLDTVTTIALGDIGSDSIEDYINANDDDDWNLLYKVIYIFTATISSVDYQYLYVGVQPQQIGDSYNSVTSDDFLELSGANISGVNIEGTDILSTGEAGGSKFLREDGDGTCSWQSIPGGGDLLAANNGSDFDDIPTVRTNLGLEIGTDVQGVLAEGAFVNGDKTKLDGIETGADVTDATNVDAAGATMNTDTDVSSNSWVLDEDNMASDSATKVPTQQSVKAYADTKVNKSLFNANTILAANSDDTPAAVTIAEQQVVGRITSGNIKGLSVAELRTLLAYLEELIDGTADEALTVTGATNVDLSAASHRNIKLTGNATLTFTNTPASGKTITRTYKIYSDTAETLGIANSTAEYGEYVADGTENLVTVMASNTGTEGLDIHVFFSTPS